MPLSAALLATLCFSLALAQGGGSGAGGTAERSVAAQMVLPAPQLVRALPAESAFGGRVERVGTRGDLTTFELRPLPGGPVLPRLEVRHWLAGVQAAGLRGAVLRADSELRPGGGSASLIFQRPGAAWPALVLLWGVRSVGVFPGLPLSVTRLRAQGVQVSAEEGQANLSRLLRVGERVRLQLSGGAACVTLLALTPVRADFAEAGRAPEVLGYSADLSVETPDPATSCR